MISLLHHFRIMMSIRISFWLHDLTTLCSDFDLWSIGKSQKYYIFPRKSCIAPNYFKLNFLRNCDCFWVILTKVWFKERRAGYKFDQPDNKVNFYLGFGLPILLLPHLQSVWPQNCWYDPLRFLLARCLLNIWPTKPMFVSKASKLYSQVNLRFNYTTYYLNSSLEVEASCPQTDPGASSWRWICQSRRTTRRCALAVIEVKHKFGSTGCRQRGWFSWQWLVASFVFSDILVPKLNSSVGKLWKLNKGQVEEGLPPFTALQLSGKRLR